MTEIEHVHHTHQKNRFFGFRFFVIIIIIFLLLSIVFFKISSEAKKYPKDQWQAVFLDNGQVYFGHIEKITNLTISLSDIYYLRVVSQSLQGSQADGQENQPHLIKLGGEIHGPQDRMDITRSHIIFIENLKPDSKVVEAIQEFENGSQE